MTLTIAQKCRESTKLAPSRHFLCCSKFLFHVCDQLLTFLIGINDDGLAFADIAFQDDPCCQGLYVLLKISSQRTCAISRVITVVGDKGLGVVGQFYLQLAVLQTAVHIGYHQVHNVADVILG